MREVIKCPVCGKTTFRTDGDICYVCGWFYDAVQQDDWDETECENEMSVRQAREAYRKGEPVR